MFLLAQIQLHDHPSVFGVAKRIPTGSALFTNVVVNANLSLSHFPAHSGVPDDFMKQLKQNRSL